ncbi:MAG: ATP-binding cassette domain-containing protein [Pseudomonadota bacterium]
MSALLDIEGLAYRYPGERPVEIRLDRLTLAPGDVVALVGPSGCGKSTVLDLLGLALAPSEVGRFTLAPTAGGPGDIAPLLRTGDLDALAEVRRTRLGYVLQQGGLLPFLSVADNIAILGRGDGRAALEDLAETLGIAQVLDRRPGTLSIGQRQRVSIARALYARPALLLADEPTASLDPPTASEVLDLLIATARARGMAVVLASHDWPMVEARGLTRLTATTERHAGGLSARFAPVPAEAAA